MNARQPPNELEYLLAMHIYIERKREGGREGGRSAQYNPAREVPPTNHPEKEGSTSKKQV